MTCLIPSAITGCAVREPRGAVVVETAHGTTPPAYSIGRYGGTLTDATIADPKTFNTWLAAETSSTEALAPLYDALNIQSEYTLQWEPDLAALPEVSKDGLTYTYRLRPGLRWSDGVSLTADDVIFTLDVLYDPKIDTPMREGMMIDVNQPDGSVKREQFKYEKLDDRTIRFILPTQWAPALSTFSFPIMPKHKLEAAYRAGRFNSAWAVDTDPKELVSSGPWVIHEYAARQRIVYWRNALYWKHNAQDKPLPYLESWTTLIVPDMNMTTLKFRGGDTDVLEPIQAEAFPIMLKGEGQGNYTVYDRGLAWGFEYLCFNMNPHSTVDPEMVKLFQDVRFRRAVSHAINRPRIADDIYQGLAQPLYGPVSPANINFYDPDIPKYPYDPDRARAMLMEIGLKPGPNGILQYHGKPVRFNILTNVENPNRVGIATIITEDLRRIGLDAQFTPITFNDLVRRLDSPPFDWQATVLGFTGSPDPNDGVNIWRSSGHEHQWWPQQKRPATPWEAQMDRLLADGAHELNPAKRRVIYNRWQVLVAQEQPFIFTVEPLAYSAIRNRFGNVKPSSFHAVRWNMEQVYDLSASRLTP